MFVGERNFISGMRELGVALFLLTVFFLLSSVVICRAELFRRVAFVVRPLALIRGEEIKLGEIARFSTSERAFEPLLERLKDVNVGEAPPPKGKVNIAGTVILQAIEEAGLPSDQIGYSIPKVVVVERQGRVVSKEEVLSAIKELLWRKKSADVQVRDVVWGSSQVVPLGETQIEIELLGEAVSGKIPARVDILVDRKPAARFLITALADHWREIPVLNRTIERGALIAPTDLNLVRVNLAQEPSDAFGSTDEIIGKRAKSLLAAGEIVRRSLVDIPPLIPKGKKVSIVYEKGLLRASATGTALEDGFSDSVIALRNDSSKRTVIAKVRTSDEVEVKDGR